MPRRRPPFDAVADLYDRVRPGYPDQSVDDLVELTRLPRRGRVLETRAKDRHARAAEIDASGLFGEVQVRSTPWSAEYDVAHYLNLLSTYSDHIELDPDTRARLFDGLADLIRTRYRGRVAKDYETLLYVAPVRPSPT